MTSWASSIEPDFIFCANERYINGKSYAFSPAMLRACKVFGVKSFPNLRKSYPCIPQMLHFGSPTLPVSSQECVIIVSPQIVQVLQQAFTSSQTWFFSRYSPHFQHLHPCHLWNRHPIIYLLHKNYHTPPCGQKLSLIIFYDAITFPIGQGWSDTPTGGTVRMKPEADGRKGGAAYATVACLNGRKPGRRRRSPAGAPHATLCRRSRKVSEWGFLKSGWYAPCYNASPHLGQ